MQHTVRFTTTLNLGILGERDADVLAWVYLPARVTEDDWPEVRVVSVDVGITDIREIIQDSVAGELADEALAHAREVKGCAQEARWEAEREDALCL